MRRVDARLLSCVLLARQQCGQRQYQGLQQRQAPSARPPWLDTVNSRTVCLDLVLGKALALSGAGRHCPKSRLHFRLFRLWAAALAPDLPALQHSFLEECSVSLQTCPDTRRPRAAGPLLLFCSILPAAGLLSSGSQESLRPLGRLQQLSSKCLSVASSFGRDYQERLLLCK